ncbi:MAG: hypothetical protein JKX96_11240 [Acinetobacter sp.]|nr:hypothetical protein [Acinetobacter sp.]MBL4861383.1 hypothetical protein [Acinetobacter sp.]
MSEAVKYNIRSATEEDAEYLSTRLKPMDIREIDAVTGRGAIVVLKSGVIGSENCRVGTVDGVPLCVYGVRKMSHLSDTGIVWLLSTDEIDKHVMKFGRECGKELKKMMGNLRMIENYCHVENRKTIVWLRWLGFKFDKPSPYGRRQDMFRRFYMEAEQCVNQ